MIALLLPLSVIVRSALPSPLEKLRPVVPERLSVPCATPSVTVSELSSGSETLMALPAALLKPRLPSSASGWVADGALTAGAASATSMTKAACLVSGTSGRSSSR